MDLNVTNVSYCAKVPKLKKAKNIEEKMPDFFRDSELFDSNKDSLTYGYFSYDKNDISSGVKKYYDKYSDADLLHPNYNFFDIPYAEVVSRYEEGAIDSSEQLPGVLEIVKGTAIS